MFGPSSNILLASSWDSNCHLYDAGANIRLASFPSKAAVLDCAFWDSTHGFCGGLDRNVKMFDFNNGSETVLGSHNSAVKCVEFSIHTGMLFTGGWDAQVCAWDPRAQSPQVHALQQPAKVFTMGLSDHRLVVGRGRPCRCHDLRSLGAGRWSAMRAASSSRRAACLPPTAPATRWAPSRAAWPWSTSRTAAAAARPLTLWAAGRSTRSSATGPSRPCSRSTPWLSTPCTEPLQLEGVMDLSTSGTQRIKNACRNSTNILQAFPLWHSIMTALFWPSQFHTHLSKGKSTTRRTRLWCGSSVRPTCGQSPGERRSEEGGLHQPLLRERTVAWGKGGLFLENCSRRRDDP
ncbi:unnamed protein product [Heterosigma akashiwo]